jgi:hypothetical protein
MDMLYTLLAFTIALAKIARPVRAVPVSSI